MTVAHWCLLAAALLPIACAWIAKAGAFGPRENAAPREWAARQSGWRARALAAQANGFEALPLFIAGVLVAHQASAPQGWVDNLALGFIGARIAYIACYLAGWASLRSVCWTVGMALCVALFVAAA